MPFSSSQNNLRYIATILFSFLLIALLFAQEHSEENNLTQLQIQARLYRSQGWELQCNGNLDGAMSLYQKAIELDPLYAVAYNDLGIIYEAKGLLERAEDNYLKSIKINPAYLSAYTNLALLNESKYDLDKAYFYWQKRRDLGSADDPWTEKAKQRLKDIALILSKRPIKDQREQEIVSLLKDVVAQKAIKAIQKKDNQELAKLQFQKAMLAYEKQDEVNALKQAIDAHLLDPSNKEIEKFIEKTQTRLLSK